MKRVDYRIVTAMAVTILMSGTATGCGHSGDTSSAAQQQQSSDLQGIIARSGGDWDKLSSDDKQHLVHDIAHGDEPTAKMLLSMNKPRNLVGHRPSVPPIAAH